MSDPANPIGLEMAFPIKFVPTDYSGLVLWMPADAGITSAAGRISAQVDQSPSALVYTQPAPANQPYDDDAPDRTRYLLAGPNALAESTTVVAAGAWTVAFRRQALDVQVGNARTPLILRQSATEFIELDYLQGFGGYLNFTFGAKVTTTAAASVGFNPTHDAVDHRLLLTYDNGTRTDPASYSILYDGVAQTVVASGVLNRVSTDKNSIGGRVSTSGVIAYPDNAKYTTMIAYNRVLTAGEKMQLDTYMTGLP